ncbi:MAG: hypothetical protein L0H84_16305, partial [Pseudonocardia sp.]|nr:hypothetical protein [Pseudonocardia sp.]
MTGAAARRRWADFPTGELWPLCYLGFLFFQPAFVPTPWGWPVAVAVAVVTSALWIEILWVDGPVRRWGHVALTVLATSVVMVNASASVLFIYAAACAGSYLPRRAAL